MEYRIDYDSSADALYIRIREDKIVDSIEITDKIIVDLNDKNEIVGIEILDFSKTKIDLSKLIIEGIETVVQMA